MANVEDAILHSLNAENVKRYVAYIEEAFRADLALRDTAWRRLQTDMEALAARVAKLESGDAIPVAKAQMEDDLPPEPVQDRPAGTAGSPQSDR